MSRGLLVPIPKVHLIWCVWEAGEQGQEAAEGCGSEQRRIRNSLFERSLLRYLPVESFIPGPRNQGVSWQHINIGKLSESQNQFRVTSWIGLTQVKLN